MITWMKVGVIFLCRLTQSLWEVRISMMLWRFAFRASKIQKSARTFSHRQFRAKFVTRIQKTTSVCVRTKIKTNNCSLNSRKVTSNGAKKRSTRLPRTWIWSSLRFTNGTGTWNERIASAKSRQSWLNQNKNTVILMLRKFRLTILRF